MTDLTDPVFNDVEAARKRLESVRWPDGPYCPHCGEAKEIRKLKGKSTRPGVYKCRSCWKPFSVTVGTVFERSKVPLNKWLLAAHLLNASKKGMSAHQLHRMLNVTYKTSWFMMHRLREAMRDDNPSPMGGPGKTIEADETYLKDGPGKVTIETLPDGRRVPVIDKRYKKILALVERGGSARAFNLSDNMTAKGVRTALVTNVSRTSDLMTDESKLYHRVGEEYATHKTVYHSGGIYVDRDGNHTNTVEGFFSIFKRGMKGIYQHCAERHLQRYLDEFSFRYTHRKLTDAERTQEALKGIGGKRLMYRRTDKWAHV